MCELFVEVDEFTVKLEYWSSVLDRVVVEVGNDSAFERVVSVEHEDHVDHILWIWKKIKWKAKVPESMRKLLSLFLCFLHHVKQDIVARSFIQSNISNIHSAEELDSVINDSFKELFTLPKRWMNRRQVGSLLSSCFAVESDDSLPSILFRDKWHYSDVKLDLLKVWIIVLLAALAPVGGSTSNWILRILLRSSHY